MAQTAGHRHPNRWGLQLFRLPLGLKQATNKQIDFWIIGKQKNPAAACPHVSNPILLLSSNGILQEPSIVVTILESCGNQYSFEFCGGLDTPTHFEFCGGLDTPTHFEFLLVCVRGRKFHKVRSEKRQQEFCTVRGIVYRSRSDSLATTSPSTPPRPTVASP